MSDGDWTPGGDKLRHNPFEAALRGLRGERPAAPQAPPVAPSKPTAAAPLKAVARAVVRIERTGRGGKEVTVVEQLGLSPAALEQWTKGLKSNLGCGGQVEDGAIVLQGDQRKRLRAILEARGVKRVTIA